MDRTKGFLLISLAYVAACLPAYFIFVALYKYTSIWNLMLAVLCADIVATIIVWFFGIIFKNSSFYDPYWSLMPFIIILFLMIYLNLYSATNFIFIIVLGFWSWRLTLNWAYTFKSLKVQDWRYDNYKNNNSPFMWHIINFFGINLIPTLFVFLGIMPGIVVILNNKPFTFASLFGAIVIILATFIEFVADASMHSFRKNNTDKNAVLDKGLWKFSRHPNYFGEISMWFGVYFFMLAVEPEKWFLFIGPLAMVFLFLFISIPLAEKRQLARRESYLDYSKRVSMLIPLPNKKTSEY